VKNATQIMCRIAGVISQQLNEEELMLTVRSMCNAMHKGGPDGEGFLHLAQQNLAFGHRRLALIDLSEQGKQPMTYQNQLWITFNGEIYNYQELKAQLITQGYTFQNATDTEVILAGYQAHGTPFFTQLRGMFAFALHDSNTQKTYLVRDSQGIKPLYYQINDKALFFASEVKAFKAITQKPAINPDWKVYFLAFGFIPEPYTTLQGVYNLAKGHYLCWDHQSMQATIEAFAETQPKVVALKDPAVKTAQLLDQAVKRHLIADAPIGVFLSGGIDSSLLSLIAAAQSKQQISTVSINFNEQAFSEQAYQEIIAKQINSKHISYKVTPQDFEQNVEHIFEDMDQPSNDGINSWFVNKVAKENGLKAVLSGIGADELFGGYPSFTRVKIVERLKQLPNFLLKLTAHLPQNKLQRISYLAYTNPIGEYLFLRGFFAPKTIAKLLGISEAKVHQCLANYQLPGTLNTLQGKDRMSWFETNLYMQNQLLKDTDYMSMAHGVEVRVPFLDQDLVKHALSLPQQQRFSQQPKSLLINAYLKVLPQSIWDRPKKGFSFPFQEWFKSYAPIQNEQHYQNNKTALALLQDFKGNRLHWSTLFAVYQVFKNEG
jgi:asparagine synthase (glutamine-hydrolysing)